MKLTGDQKDVDGKPLTEELELWWRDPVEVIKDLMGNPAFREVMKYAPEKHFEDATGQSEVINEMWTAEWWWKLQVSLTPGYISLGNTYTVTRKPFHSVRLLYQSSYHPIRPGCLSFEGTRVHGQFTLPSETLPKRFDEKLHRMPLSSLAICQWGSLTVILTRLANLHATGSSTTA